MAITSEIIGSLNTPGYGFKSESPGTYALPKYHAGASIMSVRWSGSNEVSYDIIDRETSEVMFRGRHSGYGSVQDISAYAFDGVITKGALLGINNSTPMYMYIIPNERQTPPVWNGQ